MLGRDRSLDTSEVTAIPVSASVTQDELLNTRLFNNVKVQKVQSQQAFDADLSMPHIKRDLFAC
jgi:hypothetical protein